MMKYINCIILFFLFLVALGQGLHRYIKFNDEFQVNTYITNHQTNPSVSSLSNGDMFVITWVSPKDEETTTSIFAQIFYNNGTMFGSEFQVNTYTTYDETQPSVTSLSSNSNRFVITWDSDGQDGSGYGVFAQIFNNDGTEFGTEFQVNTEIASEQMSPSITSLSNVDMFVITWNSALQDGDLWGVYAQLFDNDGTKVVPEFPVNNYTDSYQIMPSITSLPNDDTFVITWQSDGQDGSGYGIYAQIFHNDILATKFGSEFLINNYTTDAQQISSVTSLSNDDMFVVTWESMVQDTGANGVFAQIFHNNGTRSGSEFQVNTYIPNNQEKSSVASLSSTAMFVVTWMSSHGQDTDQTGIFLQIFHNDGEKFGIESQVNTYTKSSQSFPSVASLSSGDMFVITWESFGQDAPSTNGIFAQLYQLHCDGGFFLNSSVGSCYACPTGYYSFDGTTDACLENTAYYCYKKSKTINICLSCIAGYGYSPGEGSCMECSTGYYSLNDTTGDCIKNDAPNCYEESKIEELCLSCVAGYGYSAGECTECTTGYYSLNDTSDPCNTENNATNCYEKSKTDNLCFSCYAGKGIYDDECTECPTGYYSSNGISGPCLENTADNCSEKSKIEDSCLSCNAGYGFDSGSCTQCTDCVTYSPGGISSCLSLTVSITGCDECSLSNDTCNTCDPSYGLANSSLCVACSECVSYSNGGTSDCNLFTKSNCDSCWTSIDRCLSCEAGYGLNTGSCSACPTGTYNPAGAIDICQNNIALYCVNRSTIANECLSCEAGYGFDSGTCSLCTTGTYNIAGATDICQNNTAANCQIQSTLANECISCLEGYGYLDGECTECDDCITYSAGGTSTCLRLTIPITGCDECSLSNDACNTCDPSYGFVNSSLCVACSECVSYSKGYISRCDPFMTSNCDSCSTSLDECLSCEAGYGFDSGICSLCTTGTYNIAGATNICQNNTAANCLIQSTLANECISCLEGYGYFDGECTECDNCITYSAGGTSSCLSLTIPITGCDECSLSNDACDTCDSSWGFVNSSLCVSCSECVSYSSGGTSDCNLFTKSNCDSCSTSVNECLSCEAGYGFDSGTCSLCTTGTYNTADATDICQNNTALNCATKSTISNECLSCLPGYGYDALLGTCTFCSFGTTDSSGTSPCNECPANCTTCDSITSGCNDCDPEFRYSGPKGALGTICVLDCPTDYFGDAGSVCKLCPEYLNVTCRTCDSNTGGCTTCQTFNEWLSGSPGLWNTRCVVDCDEDEVKDFATGHDASCISQCPDGQHPNEDVVCIDCDPSCVTCDYNTGGCLACKEEEEWLSGPPGEVGTLCVEDCGDNVKDYATGTTAQCMKECEPGYSANANEVCPDMPNSVRILIYLGGSLLALILLFFLIIFIGNRRKIKNQHPFVIITVFIAIYDFITDTLFLVSIRNVNDVLIHFYVGTGLLISSLFINFILLMRILVRHTREQSVFKIWLKDRTALFGLIILISTTNLNVCSLWTSRLCGLRIFDAPLGDYEYQLKGLGVVSHVIEDIPQLAIQLSVGQKLYGLALDELFEWPVLLILAMSATVLSLACGLFSRGLLLLTTSSNDKKATKGIKVSTVRTVGESRSHLLDVVPAVEMPQNVNNTPVLEMEMPIENEITHINTN